MYSDKLLFANCCLLVCWGKVKSLMNVYNQEYGGFALYKKFLRNKPLTLLCQRLSVTTISDMKGVTSENNTDHHQATQLLPICKKGSRNTKQSEGKKQRSQER